MGRPRCGTPAAPAWAARWLRSHLEDRKSTRLNSSHRTILYAVFCLKKKKQTKGVVKRFLDGLPIVFHGPETLLIASLGIFAGKFNEQELLDVLYHQDVNTGRARVLA